MHNRLALVALLACATDFGASATASAAIATLATANTPPTIADIPQQLGYKNTTTYPIQFTVGDAETPAGSLAVSGSSSNTALAPNANLVFGGSGASRTPTITPATGQTGTATITVTDAGEATASDTFVLDTSTSGCAVALGAGSTTMGTSEGHAGAVLENGTVLMWGRNNFGQLGNGNTDDSSTPLPVPGITNAVEIAAGISHTAVLLADGTVWSWGLNNFGQLGNGNTDDSSTPVPVPGITNAVEIAAGDHFTTVLLADGTVWTWGANHQGQLGNGSSAPFSLDPMQANEITTATSISARFRQSFVLLSDGTLRGWGEGMGGRLGNGTEENSSVPVPVSCISNAIGVDAGDHHTLAVLADGTVWGWGTNFNGQVGDGTTDKRLTPVPIGGISNAIAVSGGDLHSVALLADGTIKAWGRNIDGQLGNGVALPGGYSKVPIDVLNISTATSVVAGGLSTYALLADKTVRAWGENAFGQLGNGAPPTDSFTPVPVSGIECTTVHVEDPPRPGEQALRLHAPFPNPMVGESVIAFELPAAQPVRVALYDAAGRRVRTLADETLAAGTYRRVWDGADDQGARVPSGIYFARIEAGSERVERSIVVLR